MKPEGGTRIERRPRLFQEFVRLPGRMSFAPALPRG